MKQRGHRIQVSTYLDTEADADLMTYLDAQANVSKAVRCLLKIGLRYAQMSTDQSEDQTTAPVDPVIITQVIEQVLSDKLDPSLFRQIVEAGVRDALSGLNLQAASAIDTDDEDDGLDIFVL